MERKQFSLQGGDYQITESSNDAFRILSGKVLVYIVPVHRGQPGRRTLVYEAGEGEVIPGFYFTSQEQKSWAFCLTALSEAKVEVIPNGGTRILKDRFARKAEILHYPEEDYEHSLKEQYEINIVREDSFIRRSQKQRKEDRSETGQMIQEAFEKKSRQKKETVTGNPLYDAAAAICRYQKISIVPYDTIREFLGDTCSVADIARLSKCAWRAVTLTENWYREDAGPFLIYDEEGSPLACIPNDRGGYRLYDPQKQSYQPVTAELARSLPPQAVMLYRSLPQRKLDLKKILGFCLGSVRKGDVIRLGILTLVTGLIGLVIPYMNQRIYDVYIPRGFASLIFQTGCLMAAFMISNLLFSVVKNLSSFRIAGRIAIDLQSAVYHRTFHLPESFFRKQESADLANRIMKTGQIAGEIANAVIAGIIALVYVLIYFCRMMVYSPALGLVGLGMVLLYGLLYYLLMVQSSRYRQKVSELEGKTDSQMFQFISGIAKIQLAGVEDRAVYEYFKSYIQLREYEEKRSRILNHGTVLTLISSSVFSIILYVLVIYSHIPISLGGFIAFISLFGSFSAFFLEIADGMAFIRNLQPDIDRLKPVFLEEAEVNEAQKLPGRLSGEIRLNHVTFGYEEGAAPVLNDISLHIRQGEYVGIVGPSGCGKSTLFRLLLGFEKPLKGSICYDGTDLQELDKREVRKQMGVVLQDGKLISGSIYDNITITHPGASMEDVLQVVREVGLEQDIREMPMGLNTILSEDCGTISGGQQQRILIARAIIGSPGILLMDEATSALDNLTQKIVCDKLKEIEATKIVIAHRLSTVIPCDRILVMDRGRIVEEGTYPELMAHKGLFFQLAGRQMI